jgi:hypothetical protein
MKPTIPIPENCWPIAVLNKDNGQLEVWFKYHDSGWDFPGHTDKWYVITDDNEYRLVHHFNPYGGIDPFPMFNRQPLGDL